MAHYYEQNGDAMRDPEIVFEVNPDAWKSGEWTPVSYRQDSLDISFGLHLKSPSWIPARAILYNSRARCGPAPLGFRF